MNPNATDLWIVMLWATAAIAILTVIGGVFFAWKNRSTIEKDPVPHCNLQERLAQIANTPIVLGSKLDLRDPVAESAKN